MHNSPLNEVNISGTVWLAADIHLGANIPTTATAFYNFLAQAKTHTDNLILCGDIFDSWIGDDDAIKKPDPWLQQAILQLKEIANTINLFIMPGNRDFLIGNQLVDYLGAILLTSPTKIITDKHEILLAHGDEYCVDDIAYQRFRKIVHNRFVQYAFLNLPLNLRRKIANFARQKSKSARHKKTPLIMDVNQDAIVQAITASDTTIMVHGHTHRPAIHDVQLKNILAKRYVLPDWEMDNDNRGGWLSITQHDIEMHTLGDK